MSFSHLHVRSGFSFLFGTFTPEALIKRAEEIGLGSVALTDKNGLYGAIRFIYLQGERLNFKTMESKGTLR